MSILSLQFYNVRPSNRIQCSASDNSGGRSGQGRHRVPRRPSSSSSESSASSLSLRPQKTRLSRLLKKYAEDSISSTDENERQNDAGAATEDTADVDTSTVTNIEKEGHGADTTYTGIGKMSQKDRRASRRALLDRSTPEVRELASRKSQYFYRNPETGLVQPLRGIHGNGKMQWWALWANPGREKQVADAVVRRFSYLPPIEGSGSGADGIENRAVECWIPHKKVRAFNIKTGKMGNKTLRYGDGGTAGVVLVRAIMDGHIYNFLSNNVNVLGFQHREMLGEMEFPKPASIEYIKEIQDWEKDLQPITEEDVLRQLGIEKNRENDNVWSSDNMDEIQTRGRKDERRNERGDRGRGRQRESDYQNEGPNWRAGTSEKGILSGLFEAEAQGWFGDTTDVSQSTQWFNDFNNFEENRLSDDLDGPFNETNGESSSYRNDAEGSQNNWKSSNSGYDEDREGLASELGFIVNPNDLSRGWEESWTVNDAENFQSSKSHEDYNSQRQTDSDGLTDKDAGDMSWWDEVESSVPSSESLPGSPVRVIDGKFKDFEGEIVGSSKTPGRIRVALDIFGMKTEVEIDENEVA